MTIDLTPKTFTVPFYSLKAGELFNLQFSIANEGTDIINSVDLEFYLSLDNLITPEDTFLGRETITNLAGNSDTELLTRNYGLSRANPFLSNGNGIYYLGAIIDPDNLVPESNENNNSITGSNAVQVQLLAVSPSSFNVVQKSATTGETVQVAFSLDNLASVVAEDVEVEFYLSSNDWISTDDYKLGSFTIDSILAESNSGIKVANFDLPPDSENLWRIKEDGTYSIGMIIPGNSESNRINNFFTGSNAQLVDYDTLDITVSNIVDLAGQSFNAIIEEGGTAKIDFSLANLGDGAAANATVDFYISHNEYISGNDHYLGSYEVADLAAKSITDNLTASFTLPSTNDDFWLSQGTGAYSIGMMINQSGAINETFKFANNSNRGEFIDYEVVNINNPEWVDLSALSFNIIQESIFDSFTPAKTIDVEYAIGNREVNRVEQDFNVGFYISTDSTIDPTDTFLGSVRVENSEDFIGQTSLVLPEADSELWTIDTDRFFVGMIIDHDNEITETNEKNNRNQGELIDYDGTGGFLDRYKTPLPDLVMESFKIKSDLLLDAELGTIDLEFAISNVNQATAKPFAVEFYISDNDYISTQDFKLGFYQVTEDLFGLSSTGLVRQSFELPDVNEKFWSLQGQGTYYVGAIIDPNQEVPEFIKSNNSNFNYGFDKDIVQVKNMTLVDLIGQELNVTQDGLVQPAETIDINFKIANQQKADSGKFTVSFYLSHNEYISSNDLKLGSLDISNLPGESTTDLLQAMYQLPDADNEIWDTLNDTYYVGMLIDPDNEVREITQLNNNNQGKFIDSDTISFIESKENLETDAFGISFNVVEEASEAQPLVPGQEINIEYEIYNQGTQDIEFSAVGFYLFTEDYLNNHEQISFDDIVEENPEIHFVFGDRNSSFLQIEADQTTGTRSLSVELPEDWDKFNELGDGYYYMGMLSDQWEEVIETNELNNSLIGELIDYEKVYIDVL